MYPIGWNDRIVQILAAIVILRWAAPGLDRWVLGAGTAQYRAGRSGMEKKEISSKQHSRRSFSLDGCATKWRYPKRLSRQIEILLTEIQSLTVPSRF